MKFSLQHASNMRRNFLLFALLMILCPTLMADVVIELKDGRQIKIPVQAEEIARIHLEPSSTKATVSRATNDAGPRTLRVGTTRALKFPSEAAKIARDGDTIEIDAGTYHNDYATWTKNDLTLRGIGGLAHLASNGYIPNGKAIWITQGKNIRIENIEFSGASVRDTNGAGIRHEGGDLYLENTFFHHNEFSILSGNLPEATIEIVDSRFWHQKRPNRHSHGVYIGPSREFRLSGSHVKGTDQGHQVKSRALANYILYNRIEDPPGGNSSRLIDLSNCGYSVIMGNDLHQGRGTQNSNVIGYGPEKCPHRTQEQMQLYVINNTLINEARNGSLVRNFAGGDVTVINNLVFGRGSLLEGKGLDENNLQLDLDELRPESWLPSKGSKATINAMNVINRNGKVLIPESVFAPPVGTLPRNHVGKLGVGSRN